MRPGSHRPQATTTDDPGADSFPASDPPSASPVLGVGAPARDDARRQAGIDATQAGIDATQAGIDATQAGIDATVEDSFPASDPPAAGPVRGVGAPRRPGATT